MKFRLLFLLGIITFIGEYVSSLPEQNQWTAILRSVIMSLYAILCSIWCVWLSFQLTWHYLVYLVRLHKDFIFSSLLK